tara:strand:- start:952 stop:1590 length:639 start_codon:yes stop_codon:yes gene_type:complete
MSSKIFYNIEDYPFRVLVEKYLDFKNLEKIHDKYNFEETLLSGTDQNRHLHKKFYSSMDKDGEFVSLYRQFIKDEILPFFDEDMIFQKYPTFRVHQPNNIAVFAFHRDRDYNHNKNEINFYLPITKAFGTNTFWYETKEGEKDHKPMEADYGEVVMWNGANLEHGNKKNETGQTRISFDFRLLSKRKYMNSEIKISKSKGKKLELGDYFDEI